MVAFKMDDESIIDLECVEYVVKRQGLNLKVPFEIVTKFKNNDSTLVNYYKTKEDVDAVYHILCEKLEAMSRV